MLSDHFIELIIDFLDISPLIASIFRRCRHWYATLSRHW
jgi:hypothetical protein